MTVFDAFLDGSLALGILATAWLLMASPGLLRAAVLFVAFGLLMALAWVRLMAPDIALAEAAIGAGVTGVLLMDALRHMEHGKEVWKERKTRPGGARDGLVGRAERVLPTLAAVAMAGVLLAGVAHLSPASTSAAARVSDNMEHLEHPVTAVLLVFRGLDTLLELGILLLALLGMLTVRGRSGLAVSAESPPRDEILEGIVRVLAPLMVLVAGYFLWLGTFAAGGAFQAGVVLGAAGVLLWLSGHRSVENWPSSVWLALVMAGFAIFLAVAALTMVETGWALQFPPRKMSVLLQTLEIAAAVSIGTALPALFVGLHRSRGLSGAGARHP